VGIICVWFCRADIGALTATGLESRE